MIKIHRNEYEKLKRKVIESGYKDEIERAQNRRFANVTKKEFLEEYIWCVVNAGMKEQIARKIIENIIVNIKVPEKLHSIFRHYGKVEAIIHTLKKYRQYMAKTYRE